MRPAALAVTAALAVGGVAALLALLAKHDLGPFSSSPQILQVPLGSQRIAGGRALIAVSAVSAEQVTLAVSCRDQAAEETIAIGRLAQSACGLSVVFLDRRVIGDDPEAPPIAVLEARWDE